jgi:hypothetical protein
MMHPHPTTKGLFGSVAIHWMAMDIHWMAMDIHFFIFYPTFGSVELANRGNQIP